MSKISGMLGEKTSKLSDAEAKIYEYKFLISEMEKDRDAFREQIRKLEQTIAARQLKEVAFEKEIAKAKEA